MKVIKSILIYCLLVFAIGSLFAQSDNTEDDPFKCSKKEIKVCPDTIMGITKYSMLQQDTVNLKKEIANLTAQLQNYDIDKFLNIQDTTIFDSKFQNFQLPLISLRNQDFYSLIENIHILNDILTNTEKMNFSQQQEGKNNLVYAKEKIDLINSFTMCEKRKVTDFLTEPQKQYYRQLVTRYNALYKNIYPDENNEH